MTATFYNYKTTLVKACFEKRNFKATFGLLFLKKYSSISLNTFRIETNAFAPKVNTETYENDFIQCQYIPIGNKMQKPNTLTS